MYLGTVFSYIKAGVARLAAVPADYWVFSSLCEHALLQVLRKVVWHDKLAFHYTLRSSVGARKTVAMHVPLSFLDLIDLF